MFNRNPTSKSITIRYGIFNNPNNARIEKAINKWTEKGYVFQSRQDQDVSCLMLLFTLGWARGKTTLTFIRADMLPQQQQQVDVASGNS